MDRRVPIPLLPQLRPATDEDIHDHGVQPLRVTELPLRRHAHRLGDRALAGNAADPDGTTANMDDDRIHPEHLDEGIRDTVLLLWPTHFWPVFQ